MNTKVLMISSAILMGIAGVILSFLPQEVLTFFNLNGSIFEALMLQVMGALYFAFAMINWTAKANLIGGIYGRPIAIGNLAHFMIAALAITKVYFNTMLMVILIGAVIYWIFALAFAYVFFTHPVKDAS